MEEVYIWLIITALCIGGSLGWWVFKSSCESAAYNRITNSNTTTWDAMFLELRVEDKPNESD